MQTPTNFKENDLYEDLQETVKMDVIAAYCFWCIYFGVLYVLNFA